MISERTPSAASLQSLFFISAIPSHSHTDNMSRVSQRMRSSSSNSSGSGSSGGGYRSNGVLCFSLLSFFVHLLVISVPLVAGDYGGGAATQEKLYTQSSMKKWSDAVVYLYVDQDNTTEPTQKGIFFPVVDEFSQLVIPDSESPLLKSSFSFFFLLIHLSWK